MSVVGIDFNSFFADFVVLDEDANTAEHHRRRFDTGPGKVLDRVRRVRDALPTRGAWRDSGVTTIGIEEPFGGGIAKGTMPLLIVLGAIIATLPPELPLALLKSDDWRRGCQLPVRGKREVHKLAAIRFAEQHWMDAPRLDDNIADAFCVAWAARELERAAQRAAA